MVAASAVIGNVAYSSASIWVSELAKLNRISVV